MVEIRPLGDGDESAFKRLRLRALLEHPEAFGSSYDDEKDMSPKTIKERLTAGLPDSITIGLFVDNELCGMLDVHRIPREKLAHVASFGGMYIAPEQRGKKLGQELLHYGLSHCQKLEGVIMVRLAVTVGNTTARNLYRQGGFMTWGVEPGFIRVGDVFYDIEWMVLRL